MLLKYKLAQGGVRGFGVVLLKHKLAQDEATRFGMSKRSSGMVLKTWE